MPTFSNYRLVLDHGIAIAVEAHGVIWDLHNFGSFDTFTQDIRSQTVELGWHIDSKSTVQYPASRFKLIFRRTAYLALSPRDPAMPLDEDSCLDTVSFMNTDEELGYYIDTGSIPTFIPPKTDTECHMLFRFRGGQMIRIGAQSTEFVLVR